MDDHRSLTRQKIVFYVNQQVVKIDFLTGQDHIGFRSVL